MPLKNYTVYLDVEVVDKLQKQGVNLSELLRNLLAQYSAPPVSMSSLEYDILRKEAELDAVRQMKINKQKELDKESELRKTLFSNPKFMEVLNRVKANPNTIEANLRVLKNTLNIDMTAKELRALIENNE